MSEEIPVVVFCEEPGCFWGETYKEEEPGDNCQRCGSENIRGIGR